MNLLFSFLLTAVALAVAVPALVFAAEICAALLGLQRIREILPTAERRSLVAVLIPAHNEAAGLLATIHDIKQQLRPADRLLVVADNCTDETAAIAISGGAEVTVRTDPTRIGKGYALDWGLNLLAQNPPQTVVVIDADCRLAERAIDHLVRACEQSQRPVQSLYLMTAPPSWIVSHQVAEFAWRVKNWMRPLGLKVLGLPCQLMGSGMAFPWDAIRSIELSSGSIVEDLKLGLDLAANGHAPLFCPSSVVTSSFPNSAEGAMRQRQRWEHGHLSLIFKTAVPRLITAIRKGNLSSVALALDLLVPPLSLLIAILSITSFGTALAGLAGWGLAGFALSLCSLVVVLLMVIVAWALYGREILPAQSLKLLPSYLMIKLRLYTAALLGQRVSLWIRADRS
jgi:cellulose synthase/poly-beta-1,6-N-acetylglucosamine synthase-like glycosyltransferase